MYTRFLHQNHAARLCILLCYLFSPFAGWSQQHADEAFARAEEFQAAEAWQEAIECYQSSLERDSAASERVAFAYERIGDCLYEQGRSVREYKPYYEKTLRIRKKVYSGLNNLIAKSHNDLAFCCAELEDIDCLGYHLFEGMRIDSIRYINQPDNEKMSILAEDYSNLGSYWGYRGDRERELMYNLKSLEYKLRSNSRDSLSIFYNKVGAAYLATRQPARAREYIRQAISLARITRPDSLSQPMVSALNNLAAVLGTERRYSAQIQVLHAARRIMIRQKMMEGVVRTVYSNLAYAFLFQNEFDSASYYIDKGLAQIAILGLADSDSKAILFNLKGGIEFRRGEYDAAWNRFEESTRIWQKQYGQQHPEIANNRVAQGKCRELQGKYEVAMRTYEQGITSNKNTRLLPQKEKAVEVYQVLDPFNSLSAWSGMGSTLFRQYQQTHNPDYLKKAIRLYRKLNAFNLSLRKSYNFSHDRNKLQELLKKSYAEGIRTAWAYYQETQEYDLLNEIFAYMQTQKALSLYEHLQGGQASQFANFPDSVRIREMAIRRELTYYKGRLDSAQEETDPAKIKDWNAQLLALSRQYEAFVHKLEQDFPRYHELKYKSPLVSLSEAQALLNSPNEGILEYYLSDSVGFVLAILPDTVLFRPFDPSGMVESLAEMKKAMQKDSQIAAYRQSAFALYQQLLGPEFLQSNINTWIIIPDGFLHYLPFEALVTRFDEPESFTFGTLSYVIKDHSISYASSCALLAVGKRDLSDARSRGMMAMAPIFDEEMMGKYEMVFQGSHQFDPNYLKLIPQLNSPNLIDQVLQWIRGRSFLREDAQEATFKKEAGSHQLIHLSTHAFVNDSFPMQSYFVLAKPLDTTAKEDGYVYLPEIFNIGLGAEMTVLTACQTGLGKFQPGEGVMSLARAFQYAGCPAIVMSMWSIGEDPNIEILTTFYAGLKAGLAKRDALRKAKLAYLVRHVDDPEVSSPDFWAGLVLLGNHDSIDLAAPETPVWPWLVGGFLGLCLLLIGVAGAIRSRNPYQA